MTERSRFDCIAVLIEACKGLGKACIDTNDLAAAQSIIGAATMLEQATDQLEQERKAEIPHPLPADLDGDTTKGS